MEQDLQTKIRDEVMKELDIRHHGIGQQVFKNKLFRVQFKFKVCSGTEGQIIIETNHKKQSPLFDRLVIDVFARPTFEFSIDEGFYDKPNYNKVYFGKITCSTTKEEYCYCNDELSFLEVGQERPIENILSYIISTVSIFVCENKPKKMLT